MQDFPDDGVAVVVGAGGGLGGGFVAALRACGRFREVVAARRPAVDVTQEDSIRALAAALPAPPRLVVDATGLLHDAGLRPEKSWRELDAAQLARSFAVNAIGPALLMKHLLPLLPRQGRAVFATLSARVGSIGDNRLGGWYGYRASKAALNQLVSTAAVELRRTHPQAICVALHPGTVATPLSSPFAKQGLDVQQPEAAVAAMLRVIGALRPEQSGGFFDQRGEAVPW